MGLILNSRGEPFEPDPEPDEWEQDEEYLDCDPEDPDLGPCCCCGGTENVRNIVMLSRRAPVPGTGWACMVCGLPPDGASYVACDHCVEANAKPREICFGYVGSGQRRPIDSLSPEVFEHDMALHRKESPDAQEH